FFQAEDGIRDRNVTGVQTCALPILIPVCQRFAPMYRRRRKRKVLHEPPDNAHSSPMFRLFRGTERFRYLRNQHTAIRRASFAARSEEHTSELQSRFYFACGLALAEV